MTEALDPEADAVLTIPVRYAHEALARLDLDAAARKRILHAAGIEHGHGRTAQRRLTARQFALVYRGAIHAARDESLGYATYRTPLGSYAFLVRSLASCSDLAACLEHANRFYRLFEPGGGWQIERDRATTRMELRLPRAVQRGSILYVHSMLLTPGRTAAWLVGRPLPLAEVTLPARFRPFASETRFLFGRAARFGSSASVSFDTSQLALPVVRAPADVDAYLHGSLQGFLLAAAGDDVERRVRALLAEASPVATLPVEQIARRLGMSRPTLARHLQRIGTGFAAVRDELRRDLAIALLGRGLRVAEVSERLGYSEPSAFQRAFKVWTGSAPGSHATARVRRART
jgi:AraC-like DNA-binding protein